MQTAPFQTIPGEHDGVGFGLATLRRMKLTAITNVITASARRIFDVRFIPPLSVAARRFETLDERLRPPVQLADPLPSLERRQAGSGLKLPILRKAHTEAPGSLALAHPPTFAITSEHLGERCHG